MPHTKRPAESLSSDIHLLGDLLGQVIRSQAGVELFEPSNASRAPPVPAREASPRGGAPAC